MQHFKYILVVLLFKSLPALAQKDSILNVSLLNTIYANAVDFTTDNLGNIYILNNSNQIKKLNNKGESASRQVAMTACYKSLYHPKYLIYTSGYY